MAKYKSPVAAADGLSAADASDAARDTSGDASAGQTSRPPPRPVTVPPEAIAGGFPQLLAACFRPDEFVAVAQAAEDESGEIKPRRGTTMTAAEWLARVEAKGGIDRMFTTKLGLFFRINPMTKGGAKNDDVTAFRHVLVEFDRDSEGKPIPKADQHRVIVESGMPVSALIDSGNKSLHALIRVDAPDAREYERRVAIVWKHFESMNLDQQNRNPSRLSRCPDGRRTVDGEVRRQSLLATNLGAPSWDQWEGEQAGAGMPSFIDLREFIENGCQPELPTVADVGIRSGMLYAGRINEIHGEPGTGKSNVAIALSNTVMRSGGTVLYIDPEDVPAGFTRRSLQLGAEPDDLIHRCHYLNDSNPGEIRSAQRWAAVHRPELVVIDGMAECMAAAGKNEDKAEDVLQFMQELVRPFAEKSGAAILISDHVTKSWEDRGLWSRGSGAKMGRYDGVSYALSLIEAYSPGQAGAVLLTVAKDRNGGVGVKGKPVVEVHFTPAENNRTLVTYRLPEGRGEDSKVAGIMAKIVALLEANNGSVSRTELRKLGKSQTVDKGIEMLELGRRIIRSKEGKSHFFSLVASCTYRLGKKSA